MAVLPQSGRLTKELKLLDVGAIALGTTLSAGLFLLPGLAAELAGPAMVLCYLLAAVPMLPAMLSAMELATAMPRAGGAYYFLDRSLGPLAGTVGGLGTWLALVLKTAFALVGMGAYIALLMPEAHYWVIRLLACGLAVFFGAINLYGTTKTGRLQIILVAALLAILAWFVYGGVPSIKWSRFEGFFAAGGQNIIATAGLVYISYVGITNVASISEEVKNPDRNLPRGVFLALTAAVLIYVLCTMVMTGATPEEELAGNLTPMATAADHFVGRVGVGLLSLAAVLAFSSVSNAGILSASRYPLAMARDHLVSARFRALSRRGTPTLSIVVTVAVILAFLLFLDPLKIAKLASAFQLLMFAMLCLAVIVMRESRIESYDPGFKSPLYPWMQIFGMLAPVVLIAEMGWVPLLFSCVLIVAGLAWYFYYARTRVARHGAVYHVFERLGRRRFDELDRELRSILKEKGLRERDPFDEVVARALVLDIREACGFDALVAEVSERFAERLPCESSVLQRGFREGTRIGATPVSGGVALPHMRLPDIYSPRLVLVRCREGIRIPTGDALGAMRTSEATYAVFFLVSPDADPGQHLRLLAQLASRVDEEGFLAEWLSAPDAAALKAILLRSERYCSIIVARGTKTERLVDRAVSALDLPKGSLVAVVHRGGETIIPRGDTILHEGDQLTIIGDQKAIAEVYKRHSREPL
jgi:APA family basic amino acid/polyamine antiporter